MPRVRKSARKPSKDNRMVVGAKLWVPFESVFGFKVEPLGRDVVA